MKNKVQNRKKERRNQKNKERELRRKKQFQHNQEKKSVGKRELWSIPQPEEYTYDGKGHKKLFHFTREHRIPSILKNGIIFGDVMTNHFDGFNAPNLTTENHFHNPSSNPFDEDKYYRLTIKCPTDADKLINYGWFDKTYCKGINHKLTSTNPSNYGELFNQYIYLGHITPSMITEVKVWNSKTRYWDRPKKNEIEDLCFEYENLPYHVKSFFLPSQLRMGGYTMNDYTGMVNQYYKENDHKDVWKDLYKLSDYLCKTLKGNELTEYKKFVLLGIYSSKSKGDGKDLNQVIYGVLKIYNSVVDDSKKIDEDEYCNKMRNDTKRFHDWVDEINTKVELKLVA